MASFIVRFNSESLPYNVAPACEQWETGQSMEIAGFSAPITVSFACGGTAKTVSGTPKNIPIPDALLEIGKDIFATFDVNGITYTIKIPVIRQEKPPVETPAAPTLPIVSDADDGKLLGVQNGKWNVVEGGSGSGGVFWVTIVEENSEFTSDKTAIEIYNAYQAGANVMAHCVYMEDDIQLDQIPAFLSLSGVYYEMDEGEEYYTVYFNAVEVDTSSVPPVMNYAKAYISSDPEVSYQSGTYTLTS